MNRTAVRAMLGALLVCVVTTGGCSKDDNPATPSKAGDFNGPSIPLGKGTAKAYVKLDDAGAPTAIGIRLSDSSLAGLPTDPASPSNEMVLALPAEAAATPFTHVYLGWNPQGHPPDGVYTLPHFDIHFYLISNDERMTIMPDDTVKGRKLPASNLVPAGYVNGVDVVPMMGVHWVDPTSPEFSGQTFTRTLVWGYWNGAQAFIEPMITKAFIESRTADSQPIKQPAAFSKAGYYPTTYTVSYDATAKEYTIALKNFVKH